MSTFLLVLLTILKIIGITLLSILVFLLFVVLIVLFVPVRYKSKFSVKDKEIELFAAGTYLLHIISVSYTLKADNPLKIRIFGHALDLKKEKKEKKEKPKKKQKKKEKNNAEMPSNHEDISIENKENIEKKEEKLSSSVKCENVSDTIESNDLSKETSKIVDTTDTGKEKDKDIDIEIKDNKEDADANADENVSKKSSTYDKIKDKLDIIKSEEFSKAFSLCKKQLMRIFKIILPKKWYIEGRVGFNDPSVTGKILAITGMLYGLIHKHVRITGDFEEEIIDIKGKFVGHITLFSLVIVGCKLYFNKNIKSIIKQFREA